MFISDDLYIFFMHNLFALMTRFNKRVKIFMSLFCYRYFVIDSTAIIFYKSYNFIALRHGNPVDICVLYIKSTPA